MASTKRNIRGNHTLCSYAILGLTLICPGYSPDYDYLVRTKGNLDQLLIRTSEMDNMDKFSLKWSDFDTNIREHFRKLRTDQKLFDVTLATDDGQHIQAHRIILAAGSQFFSDIFLKSNHANMMIYLKGIHSVQVEHLLDFLYNGEVSVGQEEIKMFYDVLK